MVSGINFNPSVVGYGQSNTNFMGGNNNVHQNLKAKYGVGYEDFNSRPYAQPYPFAIVPRRPEPPMEKSWFTRFIKKCFIN